MRYAVNKNTKKLVDALKFNNCIDDDYICPNPKCNAKVIFVSSKGSRNPYFRSKNKFSHIPFCDYYYSRNSNHSYNLDGFSIENALAYILKTNDKSIKSTSKHSKSYNEYTTLPKSIKSIYSLLLDNLDSTVNNIQVYDILCCEKTSHYHSKLNGTLLVKAKFGYNTKINKTLGLFYPCLFNENQIKLQIEFTDEKFYKDFFNLALKNKKYSILILAEFTDNHCVIYNRSQICLLKNTQ